MLGFAVPVSLDTVKGRGTYSDLPTNLYSQNSTLINLP